MKSHISGDASENRRGGFGVKDAGLWLDGRGKNMNDLVIIEQKAPDVPKNFSTIPKKFQHSPTLMCGMSCYFKV